jgi:hypothetical protein
MRVKLTYIERDFRGKEGESSKSTTRNHVARLILRHHAELQFAGQLFLIDSPEEGHKWYLRSRKVAQNRWIEVFADPLVD